LCAIRLLSKQRRKNCEHFDDIWPILTPIFAKFGVFSQFTDFRGHLGTLMPVLLSFSVNFCTTSAILSISWSRTAKHGTFNHFLDIPGLFENSEAPVAQVAPAPLDMLVLLSRRSEAPVAPVAPAAQDRLFFDQTRYSTVGIVSKAFIILKNF